LPTIHGDFLRDIAKTSGMVYCFGMPASVNQLFEEALLLPGAHRAILADKLVESLGAAIDPAIEEAHLEKVRERREGVSSGQVTILPGDEVMTRARARVHG